MNYPKPFVRAAEGHGDAAKTRFKNSPPVQERVDTWGIIIRDSHAASDDRN